MTYTPAMIINRRALFQTIVGYGAAFGLALGGCGGGGENARDASTTTGAGAGGRSTATGGTGGSGSGEAGSPGDPGQDKVVDDTFRGWATGVPC